MNGNRRNMRGRKEVKGPGKKKSSFNIYQDIQETETQKITFYTRLPTRRKETIAECLNTITTALTIKQI